MKRSQLGLAAALAFVAISAHAGTVPGAAQVQKTGTIAIDMGNDGSVDYNLDVSSLMAFDAATGNVRLNTPSSAVSDTLGHWSARNIEVNGETRQGLGWHSWQTVSGAYDANGSVTPTDSNDPWASSLVLFMEGNVDPTMNYAFSVRNNTSSVQSYTVTFGESLVPTISGAYDLFADIVGGVSSTTASAGVTVMPSTVSGFVQELYLRRVSDGSFVNAGVNVGNGFTTTLSGSVPYPYDSASVQGNSGLDAYDYWEFRTKFTLTGNRDAFAATGTAELLPVPEPESYALGAAGLLVVATLARRRRVM